MNDPVFIQSLKHGNSEAFEQLVSTYQQLVFNTALGIVQDFQEAEDIAQEVFLQVYQSLPNFRGDAKLSTWIYRITIAKALDQQRKKRARKRMNALRNLAGIGSKEEETIADFHHPGILLHQKENAALLFRALKQLPDKQRIAFLLIKAEGLSYAEAGEIMKTSIKGVEGLMHRAKENLRNILKKYYSDKIK